MLMDWHFGKNVHEPPLHQRGRLGGSGDCWYPCVCKCLWRVGRDIRERWGGLMVRFEGVCTFHKLDCEENGVMWYARTSKEVYSSTSIAHQRLLQTFMGSSSLIAYIMYSFSYHLVCTQDVSSKDRQTKSSSYHLQGHTLHLQTEDSYSNPAAQPHRAMKLPWRESAGEDWHADSNETDSSVSLRQQWQCSFLAWRLGIDATLISRKVGLIYN